MFPKLDNRLPREIDRCVFFIQNTFRYKRFNKAVIGISGGLDSAVTATLCVKALGKENVIGIMLPCGEQKDIQDSIELCNKLDIQSYTIDISAMVNSYKHPFYSPDQTRLGNIMARSRMIVLYDISSIHRGLVVGTSNKTELMMGYFTLHGDGACALEPIGHLYKTWVKEMAVALEIPKSIIEKAPSAGLWEGQTDEKEMGISYYLLDAILLKYESLNKGEMKLQDNVIIDIIVDRLNLDYSIVSKVIERIEKNKFKLQSPTMLGK